MTDAPWQMYAPAGPTIARFHLSDALGRFVAGPVGSGKTGGLLNEILYRARGQEPHPGTNLRQTRFAVIRDTYRELEKTTIPSWQHWVSRSTGRWSGGTSGIPAQHDIRYRLPDGTIADIRVLFIGLGEHSAESVMPGLEITAAYLNEMDKLTYDTLMYVKERIGRFPAVDAAAGFKGCTWRGVWGDFNKPDTDHWIYEKIVQNPELDREGRPQFELFDQPGAMFESGGQWVVNPKAENLANLSAGYYEQQVVGAERWRILQRVANRWTASRDGRSVYEEYNDEKHLAPGPIAPIKGLKLIIGLDAGLDPAAAITQRLSIGQWRCLRELVSEHGTGPRRFARALRTLLAEDFAPWWETRRDSIRLWADPSAATGVDTKDGDFTWTQIVAAELGILVLPAPSNRLHPRLQAVRGPLSRNVEGQEGFLLDPRCKVLRRGFNGHYRYQRRMLPGSEMYADEPQKTPESHPHDALQYAHLAGGENTEMRRGEDRTAIEEPEQHQADYDPYGPGRAGFADHPEA